MTVQFYTFDNVRFNTVITTLGAVLKIVKVVQSVQQGGQSPRMTLKERKKNNIYKFRKAFYTTK